MLSLRCSYYCGGVLLLWFGAVLMLFVLCVDVAGVAVAVVVAALLLSLLVVLSSCVAAVVFLLLHWLLLLRCRRCVARSVGDVSNCCGVLW